MTRPFRVALIGHWGANIGHDVMALGVERVLDAAFGHDARVDRLEQHRPLDIYRWWNPLRHVPWLRHARGGRLARRAKRYLEQPPVSQRLWRWSRAREFDLAIEAGGPLIVPGISTGDVGLTYRHLPGAFLQSGVPVLDLSLGSCFPYERRDEPLPAADADFLRDVLGCATLTTVRDVLARSVCADLGMGVELVRDTGFTAGEAFERLAPDVRPANVVISYQRDGANEDWGQGVDPAAWRTAVSYVVAKLGRDHPILFVCHSETELRLAAELAPDIPRVRPRTMLDYAHIARGALVGLCNRIHAAIALASVGAPSLGIGTDTRLLTLDALGLPTMYVKEAQSEIVHLRLEGLIARRTDHRDRLLAARTQTVARYAELARSAVDAR